MLAAVLAVLAAPGAAQAATLVVNSSGDHVDQGGCNAADCTLREAFAQAADGDTIQLGAATYRLGRELKSTKDVVLSGRGARTTSIDGAGQTRLLNVQQSSLAVFGVRFTRGNGDPNDVEGPFARRASVPAGAGGAIAVQPNAELFLAGSAVTDSAAASSGGGIASQGDLFLAGSLVAGNTAGGAGGGIAATPAPDGGAGSLGLQTVTVSDNHAPDGNGGGLLAGVPLSLESATIAGNDAAAGGGIYRAADTVTIVARNTLVADNAPFGCGGVPASPGTTDTDYNLVDDPSCQLTGAHDRQNVDPGLGPLADNGGPTDTRAIAPGSPAVDGGSSGDCPGADQRGIVRPQGAACDVGAFESPTLATAPPARISGRPLAVYADGLGRLQIRFNDDPRGVFGPPAAGPADAGLAFVADGLYYPAGGPDYGETGDRTPVSGPRVTSVDGNTRRIESTYYVGPKLLVTEQVTMRDGARTVGLHYAIENVSAAPVDFRAAELATLTDPAAGAHPAGRLEATAANGAVVGLNEATGWHGAAIGAFGGDSDVYEAFVGGGIENAVADGDLIGADWVVNGLAPGATHTIDVGWEVAPPTQIVTVNTTADHAAGACDDADCTLREAIEAVPAGAVIKLPAGMYQLERGQLEIEGHRVIRGENARTTIIKADEDSRIFNGVSASLGLSGVTLTGGDPVGDGQSDQGEGGAIRILGSGQFGFDGALAIADSAVSGNTAAVGGGVYALGDLTIDRTAITNNVAHALPDGGGAAAGGIAAISLQAWIANTTISGNRAQSGGGAITLGIFHYVNTTITENTAQAGAGLYAGLPVGGDPEGPPPSTASGVIADAIIVAGNRGGSQCLIEGEPRSSHSLAGDTTCNFHGVGDRENVDARLGPLGDHGGPTDTHGLLAGSPAIDAAGPEDCPTTDQRGAARPAGAACDAGAYEGTAAAPAAITAPAEQAVLNRPDVAVAGTAAPNATVTLTLDGQPRGSAVADANGAWATTLSNVADGDHTVTADGAVTRRFRVDAKPPEPPAIGGPEDAPAGTVTLVGQAEPGSAVTIYEGASALGTTTAGGDGAWTFTLTGVAPGEHAYSAEARDQAGNVSPRSSARTVRVSQPPRATPAPTATPAPSPQTEELPPPVPQQNVNVETKSGTVKVKLPGSDRFVPLAAGRQVPVGTTFDATKGRVTLTSAADKNGGTQTADFYGGIFKVTQTKGARPFTVLALVEPLACPRGKGASAAAKKKVRRLWGDGKGRFRTVGRYSSATVRGTRWLTEDRCGSTLVRVAKGVVAVRDLVKRKTKVLRKGQRYVARKKGG